MSKHNLKSIMSFAASTSLILAGAISCTRGYTTSNMVITLGALAYSMLWIVVNREGLG